jgi:hypothetical protein
MTLALGEAVSTDTDRVSQLNRALTLARWPSDYDLYQAYYDGQVRLESIGWALPPSMRILSTVVNWPRLAVDSLTDRMQIGGFRLAGNSRTDARLHEWWQYNDMDNESPLIHTDCLAKRRAYITVAGNDDPELPPIFATETAQDLYAAVNRRTRRVEWAVRRPYALDVLAPELGESATLYLPRETIHYRSGTGTGWQVAEVVAHGLGVVPVVPMLNRSDLNDRDGRSDMNDVMGLTDAACRSLTNLQGAQELLAVPQRYVLGAQAKDFVDTDGKPKTSWEVYLGRFLSLADPDAKIGQLPAADLRNFTETLTAYGKLVSSVTGLPPHYLGYSADNPASAEAITGSEVRLVKRAERRQVTVSGPWELAHRIGMKIADGEEHSARLEVVWGDASTPTFAAKADAVVKLYGAGLVPRSACWDALGYSQEAQAQMTAELADDPFNALMRQVTPPGNTSAAGGPTVPGEPVPAPGVA